MRVVVFARLPELARRKLDGLEVFEPTHEEADGAERARLFGALGEAQAAIVLLGERVDEEWLARAPALRVVANLAAGVNNVDLTAASRRRVLVTHTPDVLTEATADLAFGLLIAAARRFSEGESLVRSSRWPGWALDQLLGAEVHGATVGIIGLGRIGRAVAARAQGFAMEVIYAAPRRCPRDVETRLGVTRVPLDELLGRADFVSIHCPLTAETHHLVGRRELGLMKPGAVLVNTARGPIIDELALSEALASGRLGAAGLDVYEDEPRLHPALLAAPRTVLLPHLGSATRAARTRMALVAVQSVVDVLAGRAPAHVANRVPC